MIETLRDSHKERPGRWLGGDNREQSRCAAGASKK